MERIDEILVKVYEMGQTPISNSCQYLDGRPCYYNGSSLNAERIYEVLLREGDEGVQRELEDYYSETFGEIKRNNQYNINKSSEKRK